MVAALINRALIGARAEARAAKAYQAEGYTIEARNWRCPVGELDIVAFKAGLLVIVEVRARGGDFAGGALESVTPAKQRRVARAADAYLQARRGEVVENVRFDVVGLRGEEMTRVEAAFTPPWGF
ncbi:YraN family protein [Myxococcota bacterium]|nr:YraN family protein [Myxococcota bacterium]MBU1432797.1 YraN family protein [Myxococcota bacterium]MBU1897298.1 YraN family protein [Myxococcota bacterium]